MSTKTVLIDNENTQLLERAANKLQAMLDVPYDRLRYTGAAGTNDEGDWREVDYADYGSPDFPDWVGTTISVYAQAGAVEAGKFISLWSPEMAALLVQLLRSEADNIAHGEYDLPASPITGDGLGPGFIDPNDSTMKLARYILQE